MCDENLEIVKEALRHTEMRLIDLTQIAANADQRAVGFSTACVAIAAILIGLAEKTPAPTINLGGGDRRRYWGVHSLIHGPTS